MFALPGDRLIHEGVAQEVDVFPCDIAGEDAAVLLLTTAEELERVGAELQRAAQIGDEAVLENRFTRLPEDRRYLHPDLQF